MQNQQFIQFKKQRELGDILTDTFGFIRIQFKPFFGTLLKIVGPYLVVMLIAMGFYQYTFGDVFNFTSLNNGPEGFSMVILIISLIVMFVSSIITYVLANGAVLYYIKSYVDNNGSVVFNDVKSGVYKSFWSLIGLGLLVGLSVGLGMMFCLIPGIYLAVPLSISFAVLVYQQKDVSSSYSESFALVKENWWITFATLFITYNIIYIATVAFSLPMIIYTWVKMGVFSGAVDAESMNIFNDPIYVLLNVLSSLIQFLMNVILLIATTLIYFNLNEKKNFTGTYEKIENLGKQNL